MIFDLNIGSMILTNIFYMNTYNEKKRRERFKMELTKMTVILCFRLSMELSPGGVKVLYKKLHSPSRESPCISSVE